MKSISSTYHLIIFFSLLLIFCACTSARENEDNLISENPESAIAQTKVTNPPEAEIPSSPLSTQSSLSSSAYDQSAIVYGIGHAFAISAPENWILDTESGTSDGIYAIFYPEDATLSQGWTNLNNVMYANVSLKEGSSITETVDYDLGRFSQAYPNATVKELEGFRTGDDKEPIVYQLQAEGYGVDIVSYIEQEKVVVFIVSHSNSEDSFEDSLEIFKDLLASYYFIGEAISP